MGIDIAPLKKGGRKTNLRCNPLGGNMYSCTVQIDEKAKQAGQQWIRKSGEDTRCYF
jgi:hypothetical protein